MSNKSPAQLMADQKAAKLSRKDGKHTSRRLPWNCSLKRIRQELGLSLDEVANAVGISKAGYWELEQGGDPMLTTAHKLCKFFGKVSCDIWRLRDLPCPESDSSE